jgi:hypothetical protein
VGAAVGLLPRRRAGLRLRPARALPAWDESDPLYPCVLALYAFGLEECNLYPQAEEAGRRALAADPRVPWAVHAVAHVMEMQGRFEDGAAWLRQHQPHWAEGNGFAGHLWWHKALFRLEALDAAGVLRLLDSHLSGDALQITLQRVDAAAMLWRLHLLGHDVSAACQRLLAAGPADGTPATTPSTTCTGAGAAGRRRRGARRGLGGALRRRAMDPADARRANHTMAREVGLPLMRGLLAFGAATSTPPPTRCTRCARWRSASAAAMPSAT